MRRRSGDPAAGRHGTRTGLAASPPAPAGRCLCCCRRCLCNDVFIETDPHQHAVQQTPDRALIT
ncbi:hypothetical protein [Streptomyces sp. NPDC005012]|uniref:hypothetical protein n=1 Tax=Streptomyces sp. NPDC005012 TaxID=3154558 RepID=UPI0033B2FC51